MPLVLSRTVGQTITIKGTILLTLVEIRDSKILVQLDSLDALTVAHPETTKSVEGDEMLFWMTLMDTLTINKYYNVRFNDLNGQSLAFLGFIVPKNIKIQRTERGNCG